MNRIPFTLPDVGLREIEGMVWVEDGYLVIQLSNKLLGIVDEDREVIKIEPSALRDIDLRKRPFKDRLVLTPKKHDLLDVIPGKHANDVQLRVWKTKREDLQRLVIEILALQEQARQAGAE